MKRVFRLRFVFAFCVARCIFRAQQDDGDRNWKTGRYGPTQIGKENALVDEGIRDQGPPEFEFSHQRRRRAEVVGSARHGSGASWSNEQRKFTRQPSAIQAVEAWKQRKAVLPFCRGGRHDLHVGTIGGFSPMEQVQGTQTFSRLGTWHGAEKKLVRRPSIAGMLPAWMGRTPSI